MSGQEAGGSEQTTWTFVVISRAGPQRDLSQDTRHQPYWDEHAQFIDRLVDDGFILMGGPLVDEGGALLIVQAHDAAEAAARLQDDPWYRGGILEQQSIQRWQIFIDERK